MDNNLKKQIQFTQTAYDAAKTFTGTKGCRDLKSRSCEMIETLHFQIIYTKNELKKIFSEQEIIECSNYLKGSMYSNAPLCKVFLASMLESYSMINESNSMFDTINEKAKTLTEFQSYVLINMCHEYYATGKVF